MGPLRPASAPPSVRLLAKESRYVVLVHAALGERLDRRCAILAKHRRRRIQCAEIDAAHGGVMRSGPLDDELRTRLARSELRLTKTGRDDRDPKIVAERFVVHGPEDYRRIVGREASSLTWDVDLPGGRLGRHAL